MTKTSVNTHVWVKNKTKHACSALLEFIQIFFS